MPASAKNWCFTINNPVTSDKPLEWDVNYVIFQTEKASTGTIHYQGYVELAKQSRLSALKKINSRAAWYPRKGTQEQAIAYCTKKDETYVEGPWEKGEPHTNKQGHRTDLDEACAVAAEEGVRALQEQHPTAYVKYHAGLEKLAHAARVDRLQRKRKEDLVSSTLRPWQQKLMDKLSVPPDDRTIYWYWEATGNVGKTWMAKYLAFTQNAIVLDCSKKADLCYLLRAHTGQCVLFNVTRSVDNEFMGHIYALAESVKDDCVINTKYESCPVPLGPQHVVVFANHEPDYGKWSADRYDVTEIDSSSSAVTQTPVKKQKVPQNHSARVGGGDY